MQRDAGIKNAPQQIKNTLNLLILLIACLESAKYYNRIIFFLFYLFNSKLNVLKI